MESKIRRVVAFFAGATLLAAALTAEAQPGTSSRAGTGKATGEPVTVRGVVKTVNEAALAVETGSPGREMRFVLDERTVVMTMKPVKRIALSDLRKGDPVTVAYDERDGKPVAKRIWVRPAQSAGEPSDPGAQVKTRP
jgi:Cu/Ag efflux protein CusF